MSITFTKGPKTIDFTGNGLEFQITGNYQDSPSTNAYMILSLTGSLTGHFEFYDYELEEQFIIDAVGSPDPTKNEIHSGLNTVALIADALNSIYQFRRNYIVKVVTTYLQILKREKGAIAFWS